MSHKLVYNLMLGYFLEFKFLLNNSYTTIKQSS